MKRTHVTRVIDSSVKVVWDYVRPFDSVLDWFPGISECVIEGASAPDQIGAVRNLVLDGERFKERLVGMSDRTRFHHYTMYETPFPVSGYVGWLQCHEITEGSRTLVEWWNAYDVSEGDLDQTVGMTTDLFRSGLRSLASKF